MNEEFKVNIDNRADPSKIITKTNIDATECFFLVLAEIFNDLKGLVFFEKMLNERYRIPDKTIEEISGHAGEFNGFRIQIHKMTVGLLNEFLNFLSENKKIITSPLFNTLLMKIPTGIREQWNVLIKIATNQQPEYLEFTDILYDIRNKAAFHFDKSGKKIREGFVDFFFNKKLSEKNKYAYYSNGNVMEENRFYFADAAVGSFMKNLMDKTDYNIKFDKMINQINFCITYILKEYLRNKR